jgi:MarR family transcriptional regulator, negative regulator of the multidrug operon emrRAB
MEGRTENLLATTALALAERVIDAGEEATGLSAGAPAALVALSGFLSGQSVNALAHVLGLSHAGTVRLVDRLQAEGLVERRRGDGDAREVNLVATRAGRAAAKRILARREAAMAEVLAIFGPDERAQLTGQLERVLAELSEGDRAVARHMCRLCDTDACGHPDTCPVTLATHGPRSHT